MNAVQGVCNVCGTELYIGGAVLLGRGHRPTMVLCDECMHVDPRSMMSAIEDDADTEPLDLPAETRTARVPSWLSPIVAFALAFAARCWPW